MSATKPTALKRLEGTYRPDRDTGREATPAAPLDLSPPSFLSERAADKWNELAPMLATNGLLTVCDLDTLALYCTTWARWREAEDKIEEHGSTTVAHSGYQQVNAHTTLAKQYRSDLLKLADRLGLNPAARSRVHAAPQAETDDGLLS